MKESQKCVCSSLGTTPQKLSSSSVKLIHQSQVLIPFENGNLINTDLGDTIKVSMAKSIIDDKFNDPENGIPTCLENGGGFLPRQPLCPTSQINFMLTSHTFRIVYRTHNILAYYYYEV